VPPTDESATICKQQKVISLLSRERRGRGRWGVRGKVPGPLVPYCFSIVSPLLFFAQAIVRAAVHPPPRAHFFFNDFKQLDG
jgi:hypothetical protein